MELSEALRTIDATVGMFQDLQPLGEWDEDFLRTPVEVYFQEYIDENFTPCTERKRHFYHKGMKKNIFIVDITPVCKSLVNEWPTTQTRQIRKRLVKAYNLCYEAGKKSLYLFAPILYDMKWWEKEHYSFTRQNRESCDLYDVLTDTLHEMFHAIKATEDENLDVVNNENIEDYSEIEYTFVDERVKFAIQSVINENLIIHKYDYTWLMQVMIETDELPNFDSPQSFLTYLSRLELDQNLPEQSSIKKEYSKLSGKFPNWVFSNKYTTESIRRINVAKRFLSAFRKGK